MFKFILPILALLTFENLKADIYSEPPHQKVLPSLILKYDHILSFNEEYRSQITDYVRSFPLADYDIYRVPNLGVYWLEKKSDTIKDVLKREEKWKPHLEEYLTKYTKPESTAVDIGAHIGTQTVWLARAVGEKGIVIAVEPQPKFFRELFMNLELNNAPNVYYFWGANSNQAGTINLPNLKDTCEVVSLLDTTSGLSGVNAPVGTLDSLNLKNVSLIKIDVDGMEDAVLDGMQATVDSSKPVIIIAIQGSQNIETASPEVAGKVLKTKNKLIDLGYTLQPIGGSDYLCIPGEKPLPKPTPVPTPIEKPALTSIEQPSEKPIERASETPIQQPAPTPSEKPSENPSQPATPPQSEKPSQKPIQTNPRGRPNDRINIRR